MYFGISEWELVLRLVLACILGGLIGLERESIHRPAGLRTHVLVSIGSALFTLVSIYGIAPFRTAGNPADPARIAAQIVSGIGFLGAGTIIHAGLSVKGLTTAASLWAVAGVGMAIGSGFYIGAIVSTILILVSLVLFRYLEDWVLGRKGFTNLVIETNQPLENLIALSNIFADYGIEFKNLKKELFIDPETKEKTCTRLKIEVSDKIDINKLIQEITCLKEIAKVKLEK